MPEPLNKATVIGKLYLGVVTLLHEEEPGWWIVLDHRDQRRKIHRNSLKIMR